MNQRDASVKIVQYFRERSEGLQAIEHDPLLGRAVKVLEKRAEVLRVRLERRRTAEWCACGQHRTPNVVCWSCWATADEQLRIDFRSGDRARIPNAFRGLVEHARRCGEAVLLRAAAQEVAR